MQMHQVMSLGTQYTGVESSKTGQKFVLKELVNTCQMSLFKKQNGQNLLNDKENTASCV